MLHLHYLVPCAPGDDLTILARSDLASVRLRAVPSVGIARELGWRATFGEVILENPSTVLIGKIGSNGIEVRQKLWLEEIQRMKPYSQIFLDYTDHHLGFNSPMTSFYEAAIQLVNGCIVPSASMASILMQFWKGPISIIEDPIEIECLAPKEVSKKPITLLWFGHPTNIDFLIKFIATGFIEGDNINFIVLSNEAGLNYFANSNLSSKANIEFNLAIWSPENMIEAAKVADMCIIPSDLSDFKKMGASSNRLITALGLGLPTAADNLPSYQEFAEYYCDLYGNNFRDILDDPAKYRSRVTKAQIELIPRFSINKIEQDWKFFLLNSVSPS
jgi:hypothetical protein